MRLVSSIDKSAVTSLVLKTTYRHIWTGEPPTHANIPRRERRRDGTREHCRMRLGIDPVSWNSLIPFIVLLVSQEVVGNNDEPWNELGSPTIPPQPQGGALQPQIDPTTTTISPITVRQTTTSPPNSTFSNSTDLNANITSSYTTTAIPNTNIVQDGLTNSSKIPTSMKSSSKAITVDSSLLSPDGEDFDVSNPTEEVPQTLFDAETATPSPSESVPNSTETPTQADYLTQPSSNTTQSVYSNQTITSTETNRNNATIISQVTPALTTNQMTETPVQNSTLSALTPATIPNNQSTTTIIPNLTTTTSSHSMTTPFQSNTIPNTPHSTIYTTPAPEASLMTSTQRTNLPQRSSVMTATAAQTMTTASTNAQSQTINSGSASVSELHDGGSAGSGKVTKQSGGRQDVSGVPVITGRTDHPIAGGDNDPKFPDHSGNTKDPSGLDSNPSGNGNRGTTPAASEEPSVVKPSLFIQIVFIMTSEKFCRQRDEILIDLAEAAGDIELNYKDIQARFIDDDKFCAFGRRPGMDGPENDVFVTAEVYLTVADVYDGNVTKRVGNALEQDPSLLSEYLAVKVSSVSLIGSSALPTAHSMARPVNTLSIEITVPLGLVLVVIFVIAGFVAYKAYKLRVARQTYKDRYYFDGNQLQDSMSSDMQRLRPKDSKHPRLTLLVPAYNEGMELDETDDDASLRVFPSHILSINALAKFYMYIEAIVQEFQTLPDFQEVMRHNNPPSSPLSPRRLAATLPDHHHIFHKRHHSFQATENTKVKLEYSTLEQSSLDANFVMGYNESSYAYIACRAIQGIADNFWHMVWEQQSKTVILLCAPEEMGTRYSWYWPKEIGIQSAQMYGDMLVMLQGQVRTENYILSTLLIKDIQRNLCRHVTHCWFLQWPEMEIPINPKSIIVFLMQVRQTYQENPGPIVVQCSDGIGRTGTLIAIDTCMQSLEDVHSVDIPSTVSNIRRDRGSAVHNREQYSFIYKVLYEYSTMLIASTSGGSDNNTFMPHHTQAVPLRVMYQ